MSNNVYPASTKEQFTIPTPIVILNKIENFLTMGDLSDILFWFKLKMIKLVNNSQWDPMRKNAAKYYEKAQLIDEALALWILHFHDYLYISKADSDSKRSNRLHADSVKLIIIFTNYKRKLESL